MSRIHDLAPLKGIIKAQAVQTRSIREEARNETGMRRHRLKVQAKDSTARDNLLAYGYLKGHTLSQMESKTSDPDNLPDPEWILRIAEPYYGKGPEAGTVPVPEWKEFESFVRKDWRAWRALLIANKIAAVLQQSA